MIHPIIRSADLKRDCRYTPDVELINITDMAEPTAWNNDLLHNPHAAADKRLRVQKMFTAIAPSYDLNNRLHSLWRDQAWRRNAVKQACVKSTDTVVDVACGTGDLSLAFANCRPKQVIGIDYTYAMLPIALSKSLQKSHSTLQFINGDAQSLPLADACCDVVSIAFGIRNVQDIASALAEFYRILRPGGRVIILEFSEPANPAIRWLNRLYCHRIMPITATWISRDKSGAYKYLPKSIETFIGREKMMQLLRDAGFESVDLQVMTFGVCVCYRGYKHPPASPV